MQELWTSLGGFVTAEKIEQLFRGLVVLAVGLVFARVAAATIGRLIAGRVSAQSAMVTRGFVRYGISALVVITALHHVGFDLSVLVGAAGILTVALGFASQTSASNLISGLFLLFEKPFVVGDIVQVGTTTGEVIAVDLLSVKLRTFDNLLVRIPNESLLKTQITNLTHFPIRRVDLKLGVAYKEDLERLEALLVEVADANPLSLDEPRPLFMCLGYGPSSLDIQFSVWGAKENFLPLRTAMYKEIKVALDAAGIEIPFPHVSVYAGSVTEPMPVRLAGPDGEGS